MQHWDVIFWTGVILIVLGVVFLPFKPPENEKIALRLFGGEIEVNTPAIGVMALGAALMLASSIMTTPSEKPQHQTAPREEGDEEQTLKSAAYDKTKLTALASDAHSAPVQAEARDRLGVIEKEEQTLKSAAYDKTKLTPLASDAQLATGSSRSPRQAWCHRERGAEPQERRLRQNQADTIGE